MTANQKNPFSVSNEFYGILQGEEVYKYTLQNETVRVDFTNLGATILSIYTVGRDQSQKNIVAGFKDIEDYEDNPHYFGCVIGRYANRIAYGKFIFAGGDVHLSVNDGMNHLHGGFKGFNKKIWKFRGSRSGENQASIEFEYLSCDGEEGYPGNLLVKIKYILNSKNQLCIEYDAQTDSPTPVGLSNHSYFNLSGFEYPTIYEHYLYLNATQYTEKNSNNIPTGRILPVAGSPLDFSQPKKLSEGINQLKKDQGFDHNFILKKKFSREIILAAELKDISSGRRLKVYTDQPGIQLYTANFWDGTLKGTHHSYQQHGAVALETQPYPDSPNHSSFPETILQPGPHYFTTTIYEFGTE